MPPPPPRPALGRMDRHRSLLALRLAVGLALVLHACTAAAKTLKPGYQNKKAPKTKAPTTSMAAKKYPLSVLYGGFPESIVAPTPPTCIVPGSSGAPTTTNFVITYVAKNGRSCQIDQDLIGADYAPLTTAPFLQYLTSALQGSSKRSSTTGVGPCGLTELQSGIICPPLKASQVRKGEKQNAAAAAKGKPLPWPGNFERANYRKRFEVVASVSGFGLSQVETRSLAKVLKSKANQRLVQTYGKGFKCSYEVSVQIVAGAAPQVGVQPGQAFDPPQTRTYSTTLMDAVLFPDGYAFPGTFYTDAAGNPHMLGPTVESFEYDHVEFEIMNMGMNTSTHFHGMVQAATPYNDGAVGFSQGSLVMGDTYTYKFLADPAGTTFYHGHFMTAMASGNRGLNIVRKRPCNNPYAGFYDEEILLALDASNPWLLDWSTTPVTALRHTTGDEDWENFTNVTCNFCYPMNDNADPSNAQTITLDYGGEPVSDQPWAGPLINGKGRAIPMNYSSVEGSGTSEAWGAPAGEYFSVNVKKGKTYRLRIQNVAIMWNFRFYIEDHDMTIISIGGGDVKPIFIPAQKPGQDFNMNGIELAASERYDVLITANQGHKTDKKAFAIRVDSIDGCYKGVGFLLYDGQTMTPEITARGDSIQRNRKCDADCYTDEGCNLYLQFASDTGLNQIVSLEPEGIPPPNPTNTRRDYVIEEDGGFIINGERTPTFIPPLYKQQLDSGNNLTNLQNASFLTNYTFAPDQVVDWCIVSKTADRHPMHFHSDRFWVLGTGYGDVDACWGAPVKEGKPTLWADVVDTLWAIEYDDGSVLPTWIRLRTQFQHLGAWMTHCHLQYHMDLNLLLPVLIGVDQSWPIPPPDWPLGPYDMY